jgi:hypothetical protein
MSWAQVNIRREYRVQNLRKCVAAPPMTPEELTLDTSME